MNNEEETFRRLKRYTFEAARDDWKNTELVGDLSDFIKAFEKRTGWTFEEFALEIKKRDSR